VQRLPTLDAWNATLQRQITPTLNVELAYLGNKGTHVFAGNGPSYNTNEPAIGSGTDAYTCKAPGAPGNPSATQFSCTANFVPSILQSWRRRLFLSGVPAFTYGAPFNYTCCAVDVGNYFGNDASSHYNAFQIKVEKRFSQGLQFLTHYTYSKTYNYNNDYFSVNQRFAYGPDDFSRNNVWVMSVVYELPFGQGKKYLSGLSRPMNFLVGGWQVSNTTNWSGGLPFTPTLGNCGEISDLSNNPGHCRPNLVPGQGISVGKTTNSKGIFWFTPVSSLNQSPQVFSNTDITGLDACTLPRPTSGPVALPACGTLGNAGRNSLRGPHAFSSDLSVLKNFSITERIKAQFRFDAYNVFNHPILGFNSSQGNTCIDCAGAGQITAIEADASPNAPNGMRQLQFGLRATF
jgi:hypothetical protein